MEKFGAVRKAVPTPNPELASRWHINKSAQYTSAGAYTRPRKSST